MRDHQNHRGHLVKFFRCQRCGQALLFEDTKCELCGYSLGYLPDLGTMSAVEPEGSGWIASADHESRYRFCMNWEHHGCNWMIHADEGETFCRACRHNRTVPDLSDPARLADWQKIEVAKRRLIYSLIKFGLPLPTIASGDPEPLVFDFLASPTDPAAGPKIMTGHEQGVITLALEEANDARRERRRAAMGEPYRTLLGHFRHEIGHFYWDKLVRDTDKLVGCREVFGDDSVDYDAALKQHYEHGAPADWQLNYISAYATSHPWEDFAETWAHYMHIVDTLETAHVFGVSIDPLENEGDRLRVVADFDPYDVESISRLIDAWQPLSFALNGMARSMGQGDLYPFTLTQAVIDKLGYIHTLVQGAPRTE